MPFGLPVQAKMAIGPARDRFEAEADRAADHVTAGASGTPAITPLTAAPAMRMADEEDTAQRAVKDETEEVQRKPAEEEETAQRAIEDESEEVQRQAEQEEETIQMDGSGAGGTASPGVEAGIRGARGGGAPLPAGTQSQMEQGFGRDFSAVRVHNDNRAAHLSDAINARAFTTGSDIFFARGAYAPGTSGGDRLLAHELAHVAQQAGPGTVQAQRIQRVGTAQNNQAAPGAAAPPGGAPAPKPTTWPFNGITNRGVEVDANGKVTKYHLNQLKLARLGRSVKGVNSRGTITGGFDSRLGHTNTFIPSRNFDWLGKGQRNIVKDEQSQELDKTPQAQVWDAYVEKTADLPKLIDGAFPDKTKDKKETIRRGGEGGPRVYYLRSTRDDANRFTLIGTSAELAKTGPLKRPSYGTSGKFAFMQVDHFIEVQLGGIHAIENMWLLDRTANTSSGSQIEKDVKRDLKTLVTNAQPLWDAHGVKKPEIEGWPDEPIRFKTISERRISTYHSWDKSEIVAGNHLKKLRHMTSDEMGDAGLKFDPSITPEAIQVFNSETSSFRKTMTVKGDELRYQGGRRRRKFITGFNLKKGTYHMPPSLQPGFKVATLTGEAFGKRTPEKTGSKDPSPVKVNVVLDVPVLMTADSGFGGHIDATYIDNTMRRAAAFIDGMSPISIEKAGLSDDWSMGFEGTVTATLPIIEGYKFGIRVLGDAIYIDAPIPTEKLNFGPFSVTEANLTIGYDSDGPFFGGHAGFEIKDVGSGTLSAERTALSGNFDFDIDAFDPASVSVKYADGVWSGSAELGIKPGTIPFVEQGTINAGLDEQGNFFLTGNASLAGPGIPEGTQLTIAYSQETGAFTFGGEVPFDTSKFPGLTNARAAFKVTRTKAGEYKVSGTGSAGFDLAGISGTVDIGYDDGLITANGEAKVNRPPLTGSANFHLSNQAVDEEGKPVEGPPLDTFRVWGGGTASIQFGKYITATAGIKFLENGEVELAGEIALPPKITLIDETKYEYDIFKFPEVRFPIIGFTIPVVGTSFGVFGFIRGGLDAELTLGPGELVDSKVTVTYNPDRPEDMAITGGSTFQIGAAAEVGLTVTGGIGAGLAVVEATGEVGLRGALGLELSGGAGVTLNWTPTDGLAIDATVFGEAQPKFSLSVVADARVVVDAVLWSGTLWNRSWERELGSFGPDMRWRAELPASWSEQDGLDVDINKLDITYPDINLAGLAEDVFDAIK